MSDLTVSLLYIAAFIVALMIPFFVWNNMKKNTIEKYIKKSGFIPTKKYVADSLSSSSIAINSDDKKIAMINISRGLKKALITYDFSQLISVETVINDESLSKTKRGSQLVGGAIGGALLGPVGLLAGALSGSKKTISRVKKIAIKLTFQDLDYPMHEIIFFEGDSKADSFVVKISSKDAEEWVGRMNVIIDMSD